MIRSSPECSVVVCYDHASMRGRALGLAHQLGLALVEASHAIPQDSLRLSVGNERLELTDPLHGTIAADFVCGPGGFRRRSVGPRNQPMGRAIGLRLGCRSVLDTTAGLGRDAFLLACLGCTVLAVERSPVVCALLTDAMRRARGCSDLKLEAVLNRMEVRCADARTVLHQMEGDEAPDAVYIDPMFPPTGKSALVKKEMRVLRRLVGDDDDAAALLALARQVARRRVVVKRHLRVPPLAPSPKAVHAGASVRYDVYDSTR